MVKLQKFRVWGPAVCAHPSVRTCVRAFRALLVPITKVLRERCTPLLLQLPFFCVRHSFSRAKVFHQTLLPP